MELFGKIVNELQPLIILAKSFLLDGLQDSEYLSATFEYLSSEYLSWKVWINSRKAYTVEFFFN